MRALHPAENPQIAIVLAIISLVLLATAPTWLTLTFAFSTALIWCFWLDRHPTP